MLLALPIVLPLATAIALQILPQRSRLLRVVAFLGALAAPRCWCVAFSCACRTQGFRSFRWAHGRRRSGSPWSRICSAR